MELNLLEELMNIRLVMKYPSFNGTRRFITVFIKSLFLMRNSKCWPGNLRTCPHIERLVLKLIIKREGNHMRVLAGLIWPRIEINGGLF
jgi:hypothetical protein